MNWKPRIAMRSDIPQIKELIPRSSSELQKGTYSQRQIQAALGPVFGVDDQLIEDGTYFVVEDESNIVGCGGWSYRKSLFGGNSERNEPDPRLDSQTDAARVRAFFVDPAYVRQGIGSAIMMECENALSAMGFTRVEISATLTGEPLYSKFGYKSVEHYEITLNGAESMKVVKMTKEIESGQNRVGGEN